MNQEVDMQKVTIDTEYLEQFIDLLDRKILAKNFVSVLMSQDVKVFSINGGWGTGKTWFLEFIQEECESQTEPIGFIKYNVWENDYLDNPFQSIASELMTKIDSYANSILTGEELIEIKAEVEEIRKLYPKFIQLIKNFKIIPKLTYTLQDGSAVSGEVGLEYEDSKIDETNAYDTMKKLKNNFVIKLEETLALFNNKEIIIAIDELDRCRPDYAIRTLEVIKHFFHIKGLKFILAVDKQQLANTIKALYGQDADTDCYLRKFVDVEYNLPNPREKDITKYISEFIETTHPKIKSICESKNSLADGVLYFNSESGYIYLTKYDSNKEYINLIIKSIINSSSGADLRLRDIEKLFFKLNIIISQFAQIRTFHFGFLWNLLLINTKYNDLYGLIEDPDCKYLHIIEHLKAQPNNNYYKFILDNKELILIISGIKHVADHNYAYTRNKNPDPKDEVAYYYSSDLKKYFEIINMSIGFESI